MPAHILFGSLANILSPPENRLREEYFNFRNGEADEMIASWGHNETREDVFGTEAEWIEPNVKPGTITCFDILYYASDKGEEVREAYQTKPPLPRGEFGSGGRGTNARADFSLLRFRFRGDL